MKVKVSKTMAAAIRKALKEDLTGYRICYTEVDLNAYTRSVDYCLWSHEEDYDAEHAVMKVIRIEYPAEYYAMPRYLTTKDLRNIAGRADGDYTRFMNGVKNAIEI